MERHLDDDAELYALGLTESERAAEIEAHLAQCADCTARVAAAEAAAASLSAALPAAPAAAPRRVAWRQYFATAAAFVFATTTALEGMMMHNQSAQMESTDVALSAVASSHFGHTTLSSNPGVTAKALYARDGAWCYVLVSGAPRGTHVIMHQRGTTRDMGAVEGGSMATLFVRNPGRADEITVQTGDHVIAHGAPLY